MMMKSTLKKQKKKFFFSLFRTLMRMHPFPFDNNNNDAVDDDDNEIFSRYARREVHRRRA